ncbi:MAG: hypothetical protein ABFQ64_06790 [Campylobacterota bacterium]
MSSNSITIKPNNHRVYQCPSEKKIELLNKVISENGKTDILIVCSREPQAIVDGLESKDVKVIEDRELIKLPELKCEMLISYDLPIKAIVYMARVAKATDSAVLMLDESEQKELYHTEMLLGRAIKQEVIKGFEYPVSDKKPESDRPAPKKMTKDKIKEVAKKRYDEKTQEPKEKTYKPKRDYGDEEKKAYDKSGKKKDFKKSDSAGKWDKKKKEENKFLGYDENGKAKFSGKSGERNHRYDGTPKDKWGAPKKVGRKINIKARKPSEGEK